MYKQNKFQQSSLTVNASYTGESIVERVRRIKNNKEKITDGVDPIYTERKDGVNPIYDIRHDKFDLALDAMDAVAQTQRKARAERIKKAEEKLEAENRKLNEGKTQSTPGTSGDQ